MKLRTSHGTYVVKGRYGALLHLPEQPGRKYRSVGDDLPPIAATGLLEAPVVKGPLAPCTLVVLPDGHVAFRRGHLYLCADPRDSGLHFDRIAAGPWERFAIISDEGAVYRRPILGRSMADEAWYEIQPVANAVRVTAAASPEAFNKTAISAFYITEDEYCYAPVTESHQQFKLFQHSMTNYRPTKFGENSKSSISINKDTDKYIVLTETACGVVFDNVGFYTRSAFLNNGNLPDYINIDRDKYLINFSDIGDLGNEEASVFVFYDGNFYNYYHWWTECMVNIEIARSCLGFIPPVIVWNGTPRLKTWQLDSLKLLGAEVVYRTAERADIVKAKSVMWVDGDSISNLPSSILRRLSRRILNSLAIKSSDKKKLYIKRKLSRKVANDCDMDAFLLGKGFHIIHNEDYSQEEQIQIFRSAEFVIATHGAGLTNMLFMPEGSTIIELIPTAEIRTFYWSMAEKLRHKYGMLICPSSEGYFDSALDVDLLALDRLIAIMDRHLGFAEKSGVDIARDDLGSCRKT